jgi:hypothetical protein
MIFNKLKKLLENKLLGLPSRTKFLENKDVLIISMRLNGVYCERKITEAMLDCSKDEGELVLMACGELYSTIVDKRDILRKV